ncbi:MAG TPA: transcription-repair coupling factor, partial [Thermoanaerobaculia bacterium]
MILPFVRELLADLEHSEPFERVRRHLSAGTGRRRVSGLTATARALYLPSFVHAANAPCVIIVADNKAAEALHAAVLSACELTGALSPDAVLRLPAHDVLPFENLSPPAAIQERRAATHRKIAPAATGGAPLVIAPLEAACKKLFARAYYRAL